MRSDRAFAAVVFVAGLAVYVNTLGHDFVWDDLIALDSRIRFYRSPLDAFLEPPDIPGFPGVFRPLTFASFWLDQALWWRNAFGFHLTSVLLHALNGTLVYLLARAIGCTSVAALAGALLFAVHPIHTESVAWVTGRVDVLATAFALLATLAFVRVRARGVRGGRAVWGTAVAIALCAFAAAASKEPGIAVPALLVVAATFPRAARRRERSAQPRAATPATTSQTQLEVPTSALAALARDRTVWACVAASIAGLATYLVLRHANRSGDDGHLGGLTPDGVWTLFRAFGFYVERLLLPIGLRAYVPEVPGGGDVIVFAIAGVGAAALLARAPRTRFAVLWILLTLAPSMLVVLADISVTKVAERYLYLPSVGLALLVAIALSRPLPRRAIVPAAATTAAVLALLATVTVLRNPVWRDELTLWSDVTRQEHAFALPYMNLGLALADAGRLDEADGAYRTALAGRASPQTTRDTYINVGHLALRREHLDDALAFFAGANALAPHASAHYGIGTVYRLRARAALTRADTQGAAADFARSAAALTAALRVNPRHYKSEFMLAGVLYQTGDYAGAVEHYRRVVAIAPDTDAAREAADDARQITAWLAQQGGAAGR